MTDNLKVTYDDLRAAATAMTTAAREIQQALKALSGDGALDADAFSEKGAKAATWYADNMTSAHSALTQSAHSFGVLAEGLRRSAGLYALVDALEAKNAANHGKGAH